jgi:hypothetical protein
METEPEEFLSPEIEDQKRYRIIQKRRCCAKEQNPALPVFFQ